MWDVAEDGGDRLLGCSGRCDDDTRRDVDVATFRRFDVAMLDESERGGEDYFVAR